MHCLGPRLQICCSTPERCHPEPAVAVTASGRRTALIVACVGRMGHEQAFPAPCPAFRIHPRQSPGQGKNDPIAPAVSRLPARAWRTFAQFLPKPLTGCRHAATRQEWHSGHRRQRRHCLQQALKIDRLGEMLVKSFRQRAIVIFLLSVACEGNQSHAGGRCFRAQTSRHLVAV